MVELVNSTVSGENSTASRFNRAKYDNNSTSKLNNQSVHKVISTTRVINYIAH
ncbi:hypothetical protein [Salirhabdus sp. Marseille-P4669]|uniref:hypothetical protein n=1 Tax=Salirhabdus sp. Marseille-P4669 TaxID=2042310 RepID=UPI00135C085E|nr:hypothetical protein [Salirhabdus sp. Marseille-P4669]